MIPTHFNVVLLSALLFGCGGLPLRQVNVRSWCNANRDMATMLDLVVVYPEQPSKPLPVSGPEWFQQKPTLGGQLANEIDVLSLEVPPGCRGFSVRLPGRVENATRVLAFANYVAPGGQLAQDISAFECVELTLLSDHVALREVHDCTQASRRCDDYACEP